MPVLNWPAVIYNTEIQQFVREYETCMTAKNPILQIIFQFPGHMAIEFTILYGIFMQCLYEELLSYLRNKVKYISFLSNYSPQNESLSN